MYSTGTAAAHRLSSQFSHMLDLANSHFVIIIQVSKATIVLCVMYYDGADCFVTFNNQASRITLTALSNHATRNASTALARYLQYIDRS